MISLREGIRIKQPMAKPALVFVILALSGALSPTVILIGAILIVAIDLALPWEVEDAR